METVSSLTPSTYEQDSDQTRSQRRLTVQIGDSAELSVALRTEAVVHPPYARTRRLIDQYDALAAAATGGDAPAARMLYRALELCQLLTRAESRNRAEPMNDDEHEELVYCEGVGPQHYASAEQWAELAARGGDYLGRQDWASLLRRTGRHEEALHAWQAYWRDGYVSALNPITIIYRSGEIGGTPDHVRAYAHSYLYWRLLEASSSSVSQGRRQRLVATEEAVRQIGGMLNPQQQALAEEMALQLLMENPNCCIGTL